MKKLNYPNNIKKKFHKQIDYANRGMDLEDIINDTNEYLRDNDIALIYKKPTPIGISKVSYDNNKLSIDKAFFASQSTLDYNGLYDGLYVEFEAKSTECKTSFPLSNIHEHQVNHIRRVIKHKGVVFLIIRINNLIYMISGKDFLYYIDNNERKSIPYDYIKKKGILLAYNYYKGLNYIEYIDKMW